MGKSMKADEVIKYLEACVKECDDQMSDIKKVWDRSFNQYMCRKDFSKKKNWQFKVYTPISKPIIKKAVRLVKRVMLRPGYYFDFDDPGKDPKKKKRCDLTKRALRVYLNAAKFVDHFAETLESGFTLALMVLKMWVAEDKENFHIDAENAELVYPKRAGLKVKAINPYNFRFTMDNSIHIEDEWLKVPEFKQIVDKSVEAGSEVYDIKAVKKCLAMDYGKKDKQNEEDEKRHARLGLSESGNDYRKDIMLRHFWGPLIDKKNKVVMENCRFTVANEKFLVIKPTENPFWHEKSPYVISSPLKVMFRHVGKGLMEDVASIEDAIVDFVNLQLDNLMWLLLGINEVDEMALSEKGRTSLRELYPGKLVSKRTGYQGDAFKHHTLGEPPEKAMAMLQELKQFHEMDHGVTDYVQSVQSGSDTATEYAGKRSAALGDFQSIAMDIDNNFLVECIDRARDLMIQYLADFNSNPNISSICEEEGVLLEGMSLEEKQAMIVTDVNFIGKGISIFFEREERLNKLGSYVKFLNAMPEQAQRRPNWTNILHRINETFAFDKPEELIHTDEEVAQQEARVRQMMQERMMMEWKKMQAEWQHEGQQKDKDRALKVLEIKTDSEEKAKDREADITKEVIKS